MEGLPSLKGSCLLTVAAHLWHENDSTRLKNEAVSQAEELIISPEDRIEILAGIIAEEKVRRVEIPQTLREELRPLVSWMGLQIYSWCIDHRFILQILAPQFPRSPTIQFGWTRDGRIDEKKTIETLIINKLLLNRGEINYDEQ